MLLHFQWERFCTVQTIRSTTLLILKNVLVPENEEQITLPKTDSNICKYICINRVESLEYQQSDIKVKLRLLLHKRLGII